MHVLEKEAKQRTVTDRKKKNTREKRKLIKKYINKKNKGWKVSDERGCVG